MVRVILRIEGLAVFASSLYFYNWFGSDWLLFIILFLTPDLSMLGYLKDKKVGALVYNLVHNYILVVLLIVYGIFAQNDLMTALGIILVSHIGADRLFQYGLKYTTDFKDTHIKRL